MAINNLPPALQDVIQQGFLASEFEQGLFSTLAYRSVAEKMLFPNGRGETITKTRAGYKPAVPSPLDPRTNTNLDNGLTPASYADEQYTLAINMYADTIDLNLTTSMATVVNFFMQNSINNGRQAAQTLDYLARNAILNAYMGGNTYVTQTLGSPGTTINVNDVRGFQNVIVNGVPTPVSGSNTMQVAVGNNTYTLIGVAVDTTNVSAAQFQTAIGPSGSPIINYGQGVGGVSGTLTFSSNVSVADGTLGNAVVSAFAPAIIRPNGRGTTLAVQAGDTLTMANVLAGVAILRANGVPDVNGRYNLYIDHQSGIQLFSDPAFQILYRGATLRDPDYLNGEYVEGLDVRFIRTTQAPQQLQAGTSGINVRRPILCGANMLIEGTFEGQTEAVGNMVDGIGYIEEINNIVQVIRPQMDRLQQVIAQSWFWIGGYVAPTDATATNIIIPTANNAYYKRAVVFETA